MADLQVSTDPGAPAPAGPGRRPRVPDGLRERWHALVRRLAAADAAMRRAWRRSLQLRMVTITLVASSLLVGAFGYLVVDLTARSLLSAAERDAQQQVEEGAENARRTLRALPPSNNPLLPNQIRSQVLEPLANSPELGLQVTVALVSPDIDRLITTANPDVPITSVLTPQLQEAVTEEISRQIITDRLFDDQGEVTYLVYGSPVPTEWGRDAALYYFFPLTREIEVVNTIRTIVLATGTTLVVLLAVVTGLVTRLVVHPVRVAARTAQRLSAGLLDQRMAVKGEDDLALLGASFNQMATNLQHQIVRLEEMSRLQRRFTSDVSHELRTPLTTVRMAADLLWEERESYPPEVARSAELLQRELDRFEALLSDLLEISRFDAGFAALDAELTDLVPVARQAVDRLSTICERAGTEIRLSLPASTVIVEVDRRRVDRILRNLIKNAAENGERRPVEVTLAADDAAAAVTVRDHGVGLRPEEQKQVFNRFWRADPSRARQSGGTGLGLSISVEDARLHGGWLEAWGMPGQGSQFRLTLPLRLEGRLVSSPLPLAPADADGAGGGGAGTDGGPGGGDGAGDAPRGGDRAGRGSGRGGAAAEPGAATTLTGTGVGP